LSISDYKLPPFWGNAKYSDCGVEFKWSAMDDGRCTMGDGGMRNETLMGVADSLS